MFHVGQKVVCVNDKGQVAPFCVKGATYTISGSRPHLVTGEKLVFLAELPTPLSPNGLRYGFLASRFRPITERKTDISIFTAMLTPKKVRVEA